MVRIKNALEPSSFILSMHSYHNLKEFYRTVIANCVHFSVSVQQPKTEPIINHSVYCGVPGVQIGKVKSSSDCPVKVV